MPSRTCWTHNIVERTCLFMHARPVVCMAPTRQLIMGLKQGDLAVYLKAVAPRPTCPIDYQIWVAHQKDSKKDVHKEEHAVQLTEQAGAHGSVVVLSSGKNALGYKAGFVQDGHMTALMCPAQVCDTLTSALSCNIALLLDDSASSDVAIKAGDTTVHAHKTILAAQSPTFRAMFQSGMCETHAPEIVLGNIEGPVLTALMSAMYGKLTEIPAAIALPLFLAADAYQMTALLQACQQQLTSNITIDTVFPCYSAADSVCNDKLRSACIEFMACPKNSVLVAKHPDMRKLMVESPDMIQKMWIESTTRQAAQ